MRDEFDDFFEGSPAKRFTNLYQARHFISRLQFNEINFRVKLVTHRKRLRLPMETVVVYLGGSS